MASTAPAVIATPDDHIWTALELLQIYPFGQGNTPQLPIKRNSEHLEDLDPEEQVEKERQEALRFRFSDDSRRAKSIISSLKDASRQHQSMYAHFDTKSQYHVEGSWVCDLTVFGVHYRTDKPFATKLEAERAVADPAACWALYTRTPEDYSPTPSADKLFIAVKSDSLWDKAKILHPECLTEESLIKAVVASDLKFNVPGGQDTQATPKALAPSVINSPASPQQELQLPTPYVLNDKEFSHLTILLREIPVFDLTSTGQSAALGYTLAVRISTKLHVVHKTIARGFLENFAIGLHRALWEREACSYKPPLNPGATNEADYKLLTQELRDVETFACATIGSVWLTTHELAKTFAENFGYEVMMYIEDDPLRSVSTYPYLYTFYTKFAEKIKLLLNERDLDEQLDDLNEAHDSNTHMEYQSQPQPPIDDERSGFKALTTTAEKDPFGKLIAARERKSSAETSASDTSDDDGSPPPTPSDTTMLSINSTPSTPGDISMLSNNSASSTRFSDRGIPYPKNNGGPSDMSNKAIAQGAAGMDDGDEYSEFEDTPLITRAGLLVPGGGTHLQPPCGAPQAMESHLDVAEKPVSFFIPTKVPMPPNNMAKNPLYSPLSTKKRMPLSEIPNN